MYYEIISIESGDTTIYYEGPAYVKSFDSLNYSIIYNYLLFK